MEIIANKINLYSTFISTTTYSIFLLYFYYKCLTVDLSYIFILYIYLLYVMLYCIIDIIIDYMPNKYQQNKIK